jgi:hypothetical protein
MATAYWPRPPLPSWPRWAGAPRPRLYLLPTSPDFWPASGQRLPEWRRRYWTEDWASPPWAASLKVPHGEDILPKEERIRGEHLGEEVPGMFDKVKDKIMEGSA